MVMVAASTVGCGPPPAPKQTTESEVKRLGIAYMKFIIRHQGKTPANKQELEKFIESIPVGEREALGLENAAEVFQSSRDGADLVVRYGIIIPPPGKDRTVISYEHDGVNGKHMVVYETAGIAELTLEELKKLVPDAPTP